MKRCARCNLDFSDDMRFCISCGGVLTSSGLITKKILRCPSCGSEIDSAWKYCEVCAHDLEREPAVAAEPFICPNCASANEAGKPYCGFCGISFEENWEMQAASPAPAMLAAQPAPERLPVAEPPPAGPDVMKTSAESPASKNGSRIFAMAMATILVIGAAVGGAYFVLTGASFEQKLDEAIKRGNLMAPPGENAYDYYQQLKRGGASRAALAEYEERLLPQLTTGPLQLIAEMANPISEVSSPADREQAAKEWEDASRMLDWASEIKPDDAMLASRAAYARGRWAYLADRKQEAIEHWKTAADRDKGWGLPPNAVGLIFTERREYQTARAYFNDSIRREPDMAQPYNNLGTSYLLDKNYPGYLEEAESHYMKAVARAPRWARPHNWLGDIYMTRGNYRRAEAEYQTAITLASSTSTSLNVEEIRKKLDNARRLQAQQSGAGALSPAQ
jgi:tetratricopeptide (TPR) repeat protein/DNA-directed RNA polymerase subunit M/transcription elongation factor TFIIS